jgi:plastocyanin
MRLLLVLTAAMVTSPVWSQETGSLKVRFVYGGEPIKPQPIVVDKDIQFCGNFGLLSERLLVNADNGGIKNVVLYVYTGRGGSELPQQPVANKTHDLATRNCRFEPHVILLRAGDTLRIGGGDGVGHNANVSFFANSPQGIMIPPGAPQIIPIAKPEPAVIPVDCNIHPWMRAYIVALDHPFAGISDDDGLIEIKGLPAGGNLIFRLYHEAADGPIQHVLIDDEHVTLRRNLLELAIRPGVNDLGTIKIPADSLRP